MLEDPRVCFHGGLRRACEICDLADRLETAEALLERFRETVRDNILAMQDAAVKILQLRVENKALRDAHTQALPLGPTWPQVLGTEQD